MIDGKLLVEELIKYANVFLHLDKRDNAYFRNLLLREFNVSAPLTEIPDLSYIENLEVPDVLTEKIEAYARSEGLTEEGLENIFSTRIFGILSPLPSEVNEEFNRKRKTEGVIKASEYFYNLSVKNNYVQKTAISKNLKWEFKDGDKYLEITINLSKPEKDNKEIAKLLSLPKSDVKYPSCLLCKENEGFAGTRTHPSRVNIRTISVELGKEPWFIQYSPYAYFNEHLIAINEEHTPMKVSKETIDKVMDFVDYLPNYMIGSNASLPRIGGSILNHEHFQGGEHLMPMHNAGIKTRYKKEKYPSVNVGIVDWYNSVIRLESENREEINAFAKEVVSAWEKYTDQDNFIFAESNGEKHNSCSPVCRKSSNKYIIDIILRNNIVTKEYPDGVFHAHPEYHNIKKEGIGLIEAMGLFVLPGRLKKQLRMIAEILAGVNDYKSEVEEGGYLAVHNAMIEELKKANKNLSIEEAERVVTERVNQTCKNILFNTAVFKDTEVGNKGFDKFLSTIGAKSK